ncbi:MAG: hypothetical protein ACRDXC_04600 [Acidimicrobiales bacterium]
MSDTPEQDQTLTEDLEITEDDAESVKGGFATKRRETHHEMIIEHRNHKHVR